MLAATGLHAGPRPTHVCVAASVGHRPSVLRIPCSRAGVGSSMPGSLAEGTSRVIPHPTHRIGDGGVEQSILYQCLPVLLESSKSFCGLNGVPIVWSLLGSERCPSGHSLQLC